MYENDPQYGFGKTGDFYIVGNDYLMRTQSRFIPNSIMNTTVKTKASITALAGKSGAEILNDYRNIPVLSAYSRLKLPDLNWVIIAEIDVKEAMIPISRIRNQILLMAVLITTLIFIIAFFVSRMITLPIIRLKKASEQLAAGNFDLNIAVKANDEIGSLTESFNAMVIQLKEQNEKIKTEQLYSMKAMFDGQDMERQRLSREMHDGLGQDLIALKLKLEGIESKSKANNEKVKEIKKLVDSTVENVRTISNDLMPAILDEFGLITAIRNLCDTLPENTSLKIDVYDPGIPDIKNKTMKMYLYRIIQEAITNIIKHAEATKAQIKFEFKDDLIEVLISDNGKGFNTDCVNAGRCRGIKNIRERVHILKGSIVITAQINEGCEIDIKIPYISDNQ
jgi:signal transduction histidine kinase